MDLLERFTEAHQDLHLIEYISDTSIRQLKIFIEDLMSFTRTNGNDEFVLMHLGLDIDILNNLSANAGAKTKLEAFEECKKELHSDISSTITRYKIKLRGK